MALTSLWSSHPSQGPWAPGCWPTNGLLRQPPLPCNPRNSVQGRVRLRNPDSSLKDLLSCQHSTGPVPGHFPCQGHSAERVSVSTGAGPASGGLASLGMGGHMPTDKVIELGQPGPSEDSWWFLQVCVFKSGCWSQRLMRAALSLSAPPAWSSFQPQPTAFSVLVTPKLS